MDDFHLSRFLPYRLAVLSERVSKRLAVEYGRSYGWTTAEWRVLVHLLRGASVSVRDIHESANLEKPKVSRAVSRLEAAGLVQKSASASDGRLVEISLTDAGHKALSDVLPTARAIEANLTAGLTAEELRGFLAVMEKMHAVLDADPAAKPRMRRDVTAP